MTVNSYNFPSNLAFLNGVAKTLCGLSGAATYPAFAILGPDAGATEVQETMSVSTAVEVPSGAGCVLLSDDFTSVDAFDVHAWYHYVRTSAGATGAGCYVPGGLNNQYLPDFEYNSPYLYQWEAGATITVQSAVKFGRKTTNRLIDVFHSTTATVVL